MESRVNYTLVGLAVLILGIGLVGSIIWLSIGFDKKKYNNYIIYMNESVSGLSQESSVKFNGVKVGQVSKIEFSKINPQETKIIIKVQQGTPITESTYATLIRQGITGTTNLGLSPTTSTFRPIQKTPGEPYPVIPTKPSFFNQVERNFNDISDGFKKILTNQNARNLQTALDEMPQLLKDLRLSSDQFNRLSKSMTDAGHDVSDAMQSGMEGIEKFTNQALPPAIVLLRRLDIIAANLEEVSAQLRQNPSVLLRGTTNPPPGPGE